MTTKRAFLRGAAAVAAVAIPAAGALALPAVPPGPEPGADAELVALAAEVDRLCAIGKEIYARRIDPFTETFLRLMRDGPGPGRLWPSPIVTRSGATRRSKSGMNSMRGSIACGPE
jgi:hypothetical protein